MFTIEQIQAAHSKVKSGADFPTYIKNLKALGVASYELYVRDGSTQYMGRDNYTISSPIKWDDLRVEQTGSTEKLKTALTIHQDGQTDYLTFCKQSAEAGVEKWVVDISKMECSYYDKDLQIMFTEAIPLA